MNIANEVRDYIRTQLSTNVDSIDLDCNLWTEGHLDSTAILELILWLESSYNITIQNEELTPENFATLRNIEEFVLRSVAPGLEGRTEPARAEGP
jgi:methoxymalonate biosynthesis acyl carrier protein